MASKKTPEKIEKHPGGRPTKYDPEYHPAVVEELARQGKTNTEIADDICISRSVFHLWLQKHPEFSDSIKRGKETPDDNVESSLYKRALGYEYTETKIIRDGGGEIIKTEITTKQVVPDVGAQCMWLKNRRPRGWRDKQEIEHSGTISWIDLVKNASNKPE